MVAAYRFEVALSFAGDGKRERVRAVAELLQQELGAGRVFFDEWFVTELAGHDAQVVLQNIYRSSTRLVVTCVCKRYNEKPWTQEEWRAIVSFERTLRDAGGENIRRMRFLPLRFGDGEVDGIFDTAIVPDVRALTPAEIARLILERLDLAKRSPSGAGSAEPARADQVRRGKLWEVPPLPLEYQPRAEYALIKAQLLESEPQHVVLLGHSVRHAIQGMAGVGKSVLAAALARDEAVRQAFPEGVFWLTLGQSPQALLHLQARLALAVGGSTATFATEEEGRSALATLFESRSCLVVLDDVWDPKHARVFDVVGARSRLLVTTRKEAVVRGVGTAQEPARIGELTREDAVGLLVRYAGLGSGSLPAEAAAIAAECGELPLALAMVGSALRGRPFDRWKTWSERLKAAGLSGLKVELPDYPQSSLVAALQLSIEDLPADLAARYLELAVFPEDALIPEAALRTYWASEGLDAGDVQDLVDQLVDRALARRDGEGRLFLHDLQHDYLRARVGALQPLERRLVAAYRRDAPEGLHTVPDDGYFLRAIAGHLLRAEGSAALRELLFDFRWLARKLAATDTNALITDFEYARGDAAAESLQAALRLSSHVLDRNPEDLAPQLLGRLSATAVPDLQGVVGAARDASRRRRLVPLRVSLTSPGGPLLRTLLGHRGGVTAVALSADGRRALSGSMDRTLKSWDVETGQELRTFVGHGEGVLAVALSADGRGALSGSQDKTLKLWDVETGAELRTLVGHGDRVTAVALSADGRRALSGSWDKTLKLWDVETGEELRTLVGHRAGVTMVALSSDGRRALSGSWDRTSKLWDVGTGQELRTLDGHGGPVRAVAWCADGRRVLSESSYTMLKMWDVETGEELCTLEGRHDDVVNAVAWSADGRCALSVSDDTTLKMWDAETGKELCTLEGHGGPVHAVAWSADGRRVLSGSGEGTLKAWDVETAEVLRRLKGQRNRMFAVALSADGRRALSLSWDGTLTIRDVETGEELRTLVGQGSTVMSVAVSADGRRAVSGSMETFKVWDVETGQALSEGKVPGGSTFSMALSADGRRVLSCSLTGPFRVWDVKTGQELLTLEGDGHREIAPTLSADGRRALCGGGGNMLKVWDMGTGEVRCTLEGHGDLVTAVALSADGRRALSASLDRTLKLWDVETAQELLTLEGPGGAVRAVALSADGRNALTGSDDGTLKLWDLTNTSAASRLTSPCLDSFTGDAAMIAVAIDESTRRAIAADALGRIHVFEIRG